MSCRCLVMWVMRFGSDRGMWICWFRRLVSRMVFPPRKSGVRACYGVWGGVVFEGLVIVGFLCCS